MVQVIQENLKEKRKAINEIILKIGQTRGRPLLLDIGLNLKLRTMIISLRTAAAGINQNVVKGALIGLLQPYPETFGKCVNSEITQS